MQNALHHDTRTCWHKVPRLMTQHLAASQSSTYHPFFLPLTSPFLHYLLASCITSSFLSLLTPLNHCILCFRTSSFPPLPSPFLHCLPLSFTTFSFPSLAPCFLHYFLLPFIASSFPPLPSPFLHYPLLSSATSFFPPLPSSFLYNLEIDVSAAMFFLLS